MFIELLLRKLHVICQAVCGALGQLQRFTSKYNGHSTLIISNLKALI